MYDTTLNPRSHDGADPAPSPRVSVIMVCRDGLPWLPAALECLADQTFRDWELVFWDNGSRDGSADLAARLGERVTVLGGEANLPLGAARRRAVEESRGRYIALLDADDLWRRDKLDRQVARMEREGAGLCYADCHVIGAGGRPLGLYSSRSRPARGHVREALILDNFIPSCTAMVDRDVWRTAGAPDPSLHAAADYELWLRVSAITSVAYDPEPLASYRVRPASLVADFEGTYGENERIYLDLLAGDAAGARSEDALVRRALACLLWKWAGRELLAGKGPRAALLHSREAWAAAGGMVPALTGLLSCAVRTLHGLGLRILMHLER